MKRTLRFVIYTLTLFCLIFATPVRSNAAADTYYKESSDAILAEEYFGDLTFTSQEELDAFPALYTISHGNVEITGADITSLDGLANITEIEGSLGITGNPLLANLDGLENLAHIIGNFILNNNAILNDLDGINHFMTISLSLTISNNPVLGTCAVESVCFYLSNPISSRIGRTLAVNISNNADGCMDIDEVLAGCTSLPVTLVSFDAQKEEQTVVLKWKTAEEENSANFELQRSADGKNWNKIGSVKAAGRSYTETGYVFHDLTPLPGNNLYRLKMIDFDETFTYSSIRSVLMHTQASFSAFSYPNPSTDQIFIQLQDWSQVKSVQILSLKGNAVYTSNAQPVNRIQVKNLVPGIYMLRVTTLNGAILTQKLVRL